MVGKRIVKYTPLAVIVVVLATAVVIRVIDDARARPDVATVRLPVLVENTLYLRDGHRVFLDGDDGPTQVDVVPFGYVYNTNMKLVGGPIYLRRTNLVGVGGQYATLGELADPRFLMSSDGRFVVAIMPNPERGLPQTTLDHTTVAVATDLSTDRSMTDADFREPELLDVAGDWALVRDDIGGATDLWNLRTGQIQHLRPATYPYEAVLPNGQVLRGLDIPTADGPSGPSSVSPSSASVPGASVPRASGATKPPPHPPHPQNTGAILAMLPSPQGDWLLAETSSKSYLVQVSDLEAGKWVAVPLGPAGDPLAAFWDTPTSLVRPSGNGYERCTTAGRCQKLPLSAHAIVARVFGS